MVGVLEALSDPYAENMVGIEVGGIQRIDIGAQCGAEIGRQGRGVRHGGDGVEIGLQRRQALGLDARLVHVAGIVVADLLGVGAVRRCALGRFLDQVADLAAGLVGQHDVGPEGRPVGRDLRRLHPGAVGIVIEVVARLDGMVDAGLIDIVGFRHLFGILRERRAGDQGQSGSRENGGAEFRHGTALIILNAAHHRSGRNEVKLHIF